MMMIRRARKRLRHVRCGHHAKHAPHVWVTWCRVYCNGEALAD